MDKEKFAKALARFDYADAERMLHEANIGEDGASFARLCDDVAAIDNELCHTLFSDPSHNRNTLGLSLIGFLACLEEHGWSKALIYACYENILISPTVCYYMSGAESLGLYYYFKLIREDDCSENLGMIFCYGYPCTLVDDQTMAYAARKILEGKPNDGPSLNMLKYVGYIDGAIDVSETMFAAPFGTADLDGIAITYEEFEEHYNANQFAAAAAILAHSSLDEPTRQEWLLKAIVWMGDSGDLGMLAFLMYLLDEGWEKTRVYRWFVETLIHSGDWFGDGAYGLALYYCRKLVAEEETLENLRLLLSFVDAPGNFLGDDEAIDVARRILALDANDAKAREVLELVGGTG